MARERETGSNRPCPECGEAVRPEKTACPHCGATMPPAANMPSPPEETASSETQAKSRSAGVEEQQPSNDTSASQDEWLDRVLETYD